MDRLAILDLLPTHRILLDRHRARLAELMAVAVDTGLTAEAMAFIIADTAGQFGLSCLREGAGYEFVVVTGNHEAAMVIALDVEGLLAILGSVVPEGVEPVLTRPPGSTPILVVDAEDEPCIVLLPISDLSPRPCS